MDDSGQGSVFDCEESGEVESEMMAVKDGNTVIVDCQDMSHEHLIVYFLPHPNFVPLSPNATWVGEAAHSELLGMKSVKCVFPLFGAGILH